MTHNPYRFSTFLLCMLISLQILSIPAYADSTRGDKWKFQLAPYAWLAGQKGTVATLPGLPPADIDVDFYDDILGNINGALFLVGEARKGRFGLVLDVAYTDIEMEDPTPLGIFYSSMTLRTKTWMLSVAGLYRLVQQNRTFLDAIAGFRYWSVDSELTLKGATFPGIFPEQSISNSEDWVDPLIGLKGLTSIGKSKFFVSGAFVLGGFGVGSDFMWDANINLGYQWTKRFSITVGYRYLDVDYETDDFLYDVSQDGPIFGLSWRF
ncbi:MAG: hypothetical protein GWP06_17715 [Actinobacteria bacterium]|nr:hypothetical protein [Actinomycetota bacterium]